MKYDAKIQNHDKSLERDATNVSLTQRALCFWLPLTQFYGLQ